MLNRFNRLSLKKMEQPPIDLDDDIQGNQEAASKIPDLDISINLPEDTSVNSHWNPPQELNEIQEALEKRLILSKRKESVNHGLRTGRYPPWFSARFTCTLNLGKEDNEKFEVLFKQIAENKTRETAQAVINFIDDEIREKEEVIHNLRVSALKRIRNTSFNFNREQKNFDEVILNTNTKHLKDLQEFRDRLHSISTTVDKPREQDRYWSSQGKPGQDRRQNYQRRHYSVNYKGHRYQTQRNKPY